MAGSAFCGFVDLRKTADKLIFASPALNALKEIFDAVTASRVDGIGKLIRRVLEDGRCGDSSTGDDLAA